MTTKKYTNLLIIYLLNAFVRNANGYKLLIDTDYFGGDIYPIYNVSSSLECMNYCESIRGCKLATWCETNCYIKNNKTEPSEKLGCVTVDMYPEDNTESSSGSGSTFENEDNMTVGDDSQSNEPKEKINNEVSNETPKPTSSSSIRAEENSVVVKNSITPATIALTMLAPLMFL